MILTRILTTEEQSEILKALFGFELVDSENNNHFVLNDKDGCEVFFTHGDYKFDFTTLAGIFDYVAHVNREKGALKKQAEIKKVLGIS